MSENRILENITVVVSTLQEIHRLQNYLNHVKVKLQIGQISPLQLSVLEIVV